MRNILLALALILATPTLASTLDVELRLNPDTTTAGIPVSVTLAVTNNGNTPAVIPPGILVMVYPAEGPAFPGSWAGTLAGDLAEIGGDTLGPKNTVSVTFRTNGTVYEPSLFTDERLLTPGRFELQAYLSDTFYGIETPQKLTQALERALASNRATLIVQQPSGDDQHVWEAMLAAGRGRWAPNPERVNEVGRIALRNYPLAPYTLWLVSSGVGASEEERAENLRTLLAQVPPDRHTAWRLLRIAQLEIAASNRHGQADPEASQRHAQKARRTLEQLLARPAERQAREKASELLEVLIDAGAP